MYPRQFEYVAPSSLDEALAALGDGSKVMAGGMSLLPLMKTRLFSPRPSSTSGGSRARPDERRGRPHIGTGLVRHGTTASDPLIADHAAALATAASWTGDVQVRNRGTTCGSLAHADMAADQPAAVIALGGTMVARSSSGTTRDPGVGLLRRRADLGAGARRDPGRDPAPQDGPGGRRPTTSWAAAAVTPTTRWPAPPPGSGRATAASRTPASV